MARISITESLPDGKSKLIVDVVEVSRVPCVGEELEVPLKKRYRFFEVVGVMLICNPDPEAYDASVHVTRIPLSRRTLHLLDKYGGRPGD